MFKKVLFFSCFCLFLSCPGYKNSIFFSNSKKQKIYKNSTCKENKTFPQMIVVPFFSNATQIVPNCQTYPKHQTSLAMIVFYHHWVRSFGDNDLKIKNALENLMIEWSTKKKKLKTGYNLQGEKIENANVIGLTQTKSYIWVWEGYGHKISESSLMHELVHVSLRAINGHGDRDHEGYQYNGWTEKHTQMINEAKEALRSFNI